MTDDELYRMIYQGAGATPGSPEWLDEQRGRDWLEGPTGQPGGLTPQDLEARWRVMQQENERARARAMNELPRAAGVSLPPPPGLRPASTGGGQWDFGPGSAPVDRMRERLRQFPGDPGFQGVTPGGNIDPGSILDPRKRAADIQGVPGLRSDQVIMQPPQDPGFLRQMLSRLAGVGVAGLPPGTSVGQPPATPTATPMPRTQTNVGGTLDDLFNGNLVSGPPVDVPTNENMMPAMAPDLFGGFGAGPTPPPSPDYPYVPSGDIFNQPNFEAPSSTPGFETPPTGGQQEVNPFGVNYPGGGQDPFSNAPTGQEFMEQLNAGVPEQGGGMDVTGGGVGAAPTGEDPFTTLLNQYLTNQSGFLAQNTSGFQGDIDIPPADLSPEFTTAPGQTGAEVILPTQQNPGGYVPGGGVPTAPGEEPAVAPATPVDDQLANVPGATFVGRQNVPGAPGSNAGGVQGPLYYTAPDGSVWDKFGNMVKAAGGAVTGAAGAAGRGVAGAAGALGRGIAGIPGAIAGSLPTHSGGFGQPMGFFSPPAHPRIGEFGAPDPLGAVNPETGERSRGAPTGGTFANFGISAADVAASLPQGVALRGGNPNRSSVPAPGGWSGVFGQGSHGYMPASMTRGMNWWLEHPMSRDLWAAMQDFNMPLRNYANFMHPNHPMPTPSYESYRRDFVPISQAPNYAAWAHPAPVEASSQKPGGGTTATTHGQGSAVIA